MLVEGNVYNACTSGSARRKLRVEVKGIIDVADDGLEWRNYQTPR